MTEVTKKPAPEAPAELKGVVISRNGVTKELTPEPFGKLSNDYGKWFAYPVLSLATWDTDSKWVGLEGVVDIVVSELRSIFADIYTDNIGDDGVFNREQWLADCADFTAGVARLSDIESQLDTLQGLQQTYALDDAFGSEDANGVPTEAAKELEAKIKDVAKKIAPLRAKRASITAKYQARADKRKAKKEAAEKAKASQGQPALATA